MTPSIRQNTTLLIIAGALVISLTMGIRSTFGLFQSPINADLGFTRASFGFAMAMQQLLWGLFQPFCGMVADRYGSGRVLVVGTLAYMGGLFVMSGSSDIISFNIGAGWLIGFGLSATSFSVVLGALGRMVAPEKQSVAFGIATAGGSVGQFIMAPIGQSLIQNQDWSGALASLALIASLMALSGFFLQSKAGDEVRLGGAASETANQTIRQAMSEAWNDKSYRFLTLGFFVCGFQVAFITIHLPAYLQDLGMDAGVGANSLALIGFFNIIGTYSCGVLGAKFPKRYLLSLLYFFRAIVVMVFLIAPKTDITVYLFASSMGLLWLGTVPLTSGVVAQIFGPRFMSTLFGFVFFSHQVGSFLGVWIGGYLFDQTGSYDGIWYGSVVLGVAAALLHLPIIEKPLQRSKAPA
jgi:predicted MFS family arabinose efflux permease